MLPHEEPLLSKAEGKKEKYPRWLPFMLMWVILVSLCMCVLKEGHKQRLRQEQGPCSWEIYQGTLFLHAKDKEAIVALDEQKSIDSFETLDEQQVVWFDYMRITVCSKEEIKKLMNDVAVYKKGRFVSEVKVVI